MQTKIYRLTNKRAAYFQTKYCGVLVPMSFVMGVGTDPDLRAEMVVTDKFTQDAIENDPRFGKLFFLAETYGEPDVEEAPVEVEKKGKKGIKKAAKAEEPKDGAKVFKSINDAVYYLEEELGLDTTEDNLEQLMKDNNIVVE